MTKMDLPGISPRAKSALRELRWEQSPERSARPPHAWRPWHFARFGGSPIPIRLESWEGFRHTRLYLGPSFAGDDEVTARPAVDVVVNLCECDDRFPEAAADLRWRRGEGVFGYTWHALDTDSRQVADLLRADQSVLIHCLAGVNRSATLTCATLMQVEGLDAGAALARVYRFHQPSHPEDGHWLALRQLEIVLSDRRQGR